MIVFAGIDGTGIGKGEKDSEGHTYAQIFEDSHVHTIYKKWPHRDLCFYSRGPTNIGMETGQLAQLAYNFVVDRISSGKARGVFLSGYSRGAAAVIETAKWLRNRYLGFGTINVDCLILYDAVDRSTEVGGLIYDTPICDNVRECYHAMRDPLACSRESFSNCGQEIQDGSKTMYYEEKFFCTHGGLGGTPWGGPEGKFIDEGWPDNETKITPRVDKLGAKQVWDWTYPRLQNSFIRCTNRIKKEMQAEAVSRQNAPKPTPCPAPSPGPMPTR